MAGLALAWKDGNWGPGDTRPTDCSVLMYARAKVPGTQLHKCGEESSLLSSSLGHPARVPRCPEISHLLLLTPTCCPPLHSDPPLGGLGEPPVFLSPSGRSPF